jgi:hypothetical protein
MADLPKRVRISAFDFTVEDWKPHSATASGRFGEFSCLEQVIRVDTSVNKIKVLDTFLHEIFHAIYWAYGIEDGDNEERTVGMLATAMTQVLRDNPSLHGLISSTFGSENDL